MASNTLKIFLLGALAACGNPESNVEAPPEPAALSTEQIAQQAALTDALAQYEAWRDELMMSTRPFEEVWKEQARRKLARAQAQPEGFQRELALRTAQDQFWRLAGIWQTDKVAAIMDEVGIDKTLIAPEAFKAVLLEDADRLDADNLAWLKAEYEEKGSWFTISEYGETTSENAWLIIQHGADDQPLMQKVLTEMETLHPLGEVEGGSYALLYDRVEMFAGRPQRYGSQMTCQDDGSFGPHELEDPDNIDALRASVGLPPFAEYLAYYENQSC